MKKMIILGLMLLLAGCGQHPTLDPVIQNNPPVAVPVIEPLVLNPIEWKVLTVKEMNKLIANSKSDFVLFGMDSTSYQNYNLNFVEISRYIKEQKAVIDLLKKVEEDRSTVVEEKKVVK